jgi:hypothetical protein
MSTPSTLTVNQAARDGRQFASIDLRLAVELPEFTFFDRRACILVRLSILPLQVNDSVAGA